MVMGIIWRLQGAGLLAWAAESFMLARREWVLYGAAITAAGAVVLEFVQWSACR